MSNYLFIIIDIKKLYYWKIIEITYRDKGVSELLWYIRPAGYTGEQEIYNAKSIDNYFGKNPTAKNLEVKNLVL